MAMAKSSDLVHWNYVGDVFQQRPSWASSNGYLWAPDIEYFNGQYYLYYAVSSTTTGNGSAIFVATSASPTGPWLASGSPVVEAQGMREVIDPTIVQDDSGQRYIFYGSFNGGIAARTLSADGTSSTPSSEVQITTSDRYEAAYVVKRNGYHYLFASASNCCVGPLTGYAVFAGRSKNVLGPYVDADGVSLLDPRVGGTPVIAMNGNRWMGPGHNAVFTDASGQDWMIYHAVDVDQPYFSNGWTRRPLLMDPIDWVNDWPRVRNGAGPSDSGQTGPVTASGQSNPHTPGTMPFDNPGAEITASSDDFSGQSLSPQWTWIRPPQPQSFAEANGTFRFDTQAGALYVGSNNVSILTEPAPTSDFVVEVKLSTTVPITGSHSYVQGGVLIYADDNNYVKLVDVAINNTRQIEFGLQTDGEPAAYPQYGSTLLASPADNTYLRIVRRSVASGGETYVPYSSHDGVTWQRGGTWTHNFGSNAKIGLVSMNGAGFSTYFDYVRVYALSN
jgi:arabinan endo-1,5-alpha-L-arabinosidase